MSSNILNSLKERRTYYDINKKVSVSDGTIEEVIKEAQKYSPYAFNSQSGRTILLLDKEHDKLWDITKEELRKVVPADSFQPTEDKINSFKNGYGTVLFFEDQDVIKGLQDNFELYKHNFPVWSEQATGMFQLVVWTALKEIGLGASLQHYTELIEEEVRKEWNVAPSWKLKAQMPFGSPGSEPDPKEFQYSDDHFKLYK